MELDCAAIAANSRSFAQLIPGYMAVVKADAFGHGAAPVARTALANGAAWLGVATIEEALALRAVGFAAPTLAWVAAPGAAFGAAISAGVDVALSSLAQLDAVAAAASAARGTARIHLFADTGMTREGCPQGQWEEVCTRAAALQRAGLVSVVGLMSHLACADQPQLEVNSAALAQFSELTRAAQRCGLRPRVRHIAATAAALDMPQARLDLIRIGAGLYGIDCPPAHGLRRALTLRAPLVMVREANPGTHVGYGMQYTVPARTRLGLVGVGYADGLPRAAEGAARVQVLGRPCPVLGRISMDQIVVDLGDLPATPGTPAVVFGPGDRGEPTTADWASWAGCLEREIVTSLSTRLARRVLNEPALGGPPAPPPHQPPAHPLRARLGVPRRRAAL